MSLSRKLGLAHLARVLLASPRYPKSVDLLVPDRFLQAEFKLRTAFVCE